MQSYLFCFNLVIDGINVDSRENKDIIIENIQGTGISSDHGCIIAGLKDIPAENIIINNVNLTFDGGGKAEDTFRKIPEAEQCYPKDPVSVFLSVLGEKSRE